MTGNALSRVRDRGFILPLGTYDNGETGLAWPEIIHGPASAVHSLFTNPTPYLDQSPDEKRRTIGNSFEAAGSAALGSFAATRPANALTQGAARIRSRRPSVYDEIADALENRPWDVGPLFNKAAQQRSPKGPYEAYTGSALAPGDIGLDRPGPRTLWASDTPSNAATYINAGASDTGNVMPLRFDFKNPKVVDGEGRVWNDLYIDGRHTMTDLEAMRARSAGHDGIIFKNTIDQASDSWQSGAKPQTTFAALQPGTTYNALTGDLVYANGSPLNALLASYYGQDRR